MTELNLSDAIRARGRQLFAAVAQEKPSLFDKGRWTGALMDWCMRDEAFKVQMFRFVDVFPSLATPDALVRHLQEYFDDSEQTPAFLRTAVKGAGFGGSLGARMAGAGIRSQIEDMARQFIVGADTREALKKIAGLRRDGFAAVLDVLGEATISPKEEEHFERIYLELVDALAAESAQWPALGGDGLDWGSAPRVQVSIKPTSLCCTARAMDFDNAVAAMMVRMTRLYERVVQAKGFLCIDMESLKYKNLTLALYRRLRADPRWRGEARLGIVLQAYLRDSERDLDDLLAWARAERLPIAIRLVKGAYWDVETVLAKQNGWAVPVWQQKAESDACFERMARRILENSEICHLACASHNIRSIAMVLETAQALRVPESRYEFQVLYGMAEPVREALRKQVGRVRLYAPYGDMIPGMAYLVRRLLENTANESFLRQRFVEATEVDRLLQDPAQLVAHSKTPPPPPPAVDPATGLPPFTNEPACDFTRAEERAAFAAALGQVRTELGRVYPLHIGGKDVATTDRLPSTNPARPDEVVGMICQGGQAETSAAIAAAHAAFPAWRDTPPAARAAVLRKAAELLRRRIAYYAAWQVLEVGKQWDQAHADLAEAIDFLEYYAREMLRLSKPRRMGHVPGETNDYLQEPRGVVAVIGPWNFPLAISCGMCAAAIATGNTVVYKPSGVTAVVGHHLVEVFREAGLPAGVFNYLPGRGRVMGDFLVDHPDVTAIAFTGSMEVGLRIIERAAKVQPGQAYVKKVICEMGGKNAIIVDDDADLDEAVPAVLYSAFGFQGQKCSACSRVIVLDAVYERFLARLVEAAQALTVGPAEDPHHTLGPVADAAAQQSIQSYIELGAREGKIVYQSACPTGGCYVPATIVAGLTPEHRLAQEEVFGPVLAVMRARDFDQAIAWANSTRFALTGGLFSRSPVHIARARREFRVGNLYLNRGSTGALVERQPFGGARMSGVGTKAGGPDYLLHFTDPRTITENTLRRGFAPQE